MANLEKYKGVIPAFYACYDAEGNVSPERVRALTEYHIRKGVKGVYVNGSSGECIYQSLEDRKITLENVMAAAYIGLLMGVPFEKIQETVRQFKPVEHRIEFVRERTGVRYYNDSKGTNPDAAIQALRAMPGPVLLIAGGYDKNSNYDE